MHLFRHAFAAILALVVMATSLTTACAARPTSTPEEDLAAGYFGAQPWELPGDAEKMRVDSVVDGDTLKLTKPNDDWWEPYRLIGIQAPEMEGPYTDQQCYGPEAKEFMTEFLPKGSEVYVEQDISDTDHNGRYLRHVFIVDEDAGGAFLVSEVLVLGGYAKARSYPPDDLYDDVLQEAQEIADREDAGLWDTCTA